MTEKFKAAHIEEALRNSAGIVKDAARALGCAPATVRNYVKRYKSLRTALDDMLEDNLDLAESKLLQNIEAGKEASVFFYLKTKGKHRGYVERVETTGKDGGPIMMKLDLETVKRARQRNIELVDEVARRLAGGVVGETAESAEAEDPQPAEPDGGG